MRRSKENRTVVITGVSSGVGLALCNYFIHKKWNVIGVSRTEPIYKKLNDKFHFIKADISKINIYDEIKKFTNNIDVLINNAGAFIEKSLATCHKSDVDKIIDTNLKGTIYTTAACLQLMKRGRIISIGSVAGIHGIMYQSIYCASKYGINGFFDSLCYELNSKGILVTTINPGGIDTPLWHKGNPYKGNKEQLLKSDDIVSVVDYIINLPPHVVLKNITVYPTNEIH